MNIELQIIRNGYDRKTCWVHARPGMIPGDVVTGVITTQKLRLTGNDVFYSIHSMHSIDGGQTWSEPISQSTLARRKVENNIEEGISDFSLSWHAASGTLLGTGHSIRYINDDLQPLPRKRNTVYSVYNPAQHLWQQWKTLEFPENVSFFNEGAGSTQRLDLADGTILLPTYIALQQKTGQVFEFQSAAAVMRCSFDGQNLRYLEHGNEVTIPSGRGFAEPSIAYAAERYFLTLRNNDAGYITTSDDGLHYDDPKPWTFDDGSDLGSYNTQQHWLTHGDDLYLVYTRRGADNDHIFRHRAPLFIAQVDTDRLCVIRDTERILVPQRGARLGNFGVAKINENESWVVVSEWMQTNAPNPFDSTLCEKWGSDNSIFLAKVTF